MLPTPISWQAVLSTLAPVGKSCRARWLASSWLQIDSAVRLGCARTASGQGARAARARARVPARSPWPPRLGRRP